MNLKECCHKCKYCIEVYSPLPKIEAPRFIYYCILNLERSESIKKLGYFVDTLDFKCRYFERK